MPPIITEQWPRFILPIVRKEWELKLAATPSPAFGFYGIFSSESSVEYSQGVGGIGEIPEYNAASAEGAPGAIAYADFNPLYESTFTHKEYALGIAIERKLWDDDSKGLIKRRGQSLGYSFGLTRARHASSIFNNAFSGVTGGDGVVLCSASHPRNINDTALISNLGTSALSYNAVKDTIVAGSQMTDDKGDPMPVVYDTLYVPTTLQAEAWTIANSMKVPGGADNDESFVADRNLSVVVDPYLTDSDNWFMLDSALSPMHMLWFNRVLPELTMDPQSDYLLVARYRGYMRYSYGWDDFRFIYGHNVS